MDRWRTGTVWSRFAWHLGCAAALASLAVACRRDSPERIQARGGGWPRARCAARADAQTSAWREASIGRLLTFRVPPGLEPAPVEWIDGTSGVWRDGGQQFSWQGGHVGLSGIRQMQFEAPDYRECRARIGGLDAAVVTATVGGRFVATALLEDPAGDFRFYLGGAGPTPADQRTMLAAIYTARRVPPSP